jgi:hypothetical protein
MATYCENCGAELVEGHRFCRQCGKEARPAQAEEAPTRIFDGQAQPSVPFMTSRLQEARTDPVYHPRPTAPQPLYAQQTVSPLADRRPARSHKWVYLLVALGILGSIFITLLIFASQSSLPNQPRIVVKQVGHPPAPPAPNTGQATGLPLDESEAEVSDDETVIEKSYPLRDGATVALKNVSGDIKVEGWDEDHAEVRIIKTGGSPEEREAVSITQSAAPNKLSLEVPMTSNTSVEVRYELRLPRKVSAVSISSMKSDVKLSEIDGAVAIDLQKGSIELKEINGPIKAKTIKGNIKAEMEASARKGSQEFSTVKGDIELQFEGELNADIKAETVDGKIEADDAFHLQVTKQPVGQHVAGHVGTGGDPLLAKTVNGNIKLKK